MDYRKEAAQELKDLLKRQNAVSTLREELMDLSGRLTAVKSPCADATPVQGGSAPIEERTINLIVKRDELRAMLQTSARRVARTERALTCLTDQQREFLTVFYVDRPRGHVEALMSKYHVERATVYRIKDEALRDFTIARYGGLGWG